MPTTNFVDGTTPIEAAWLNEADDAVFVDIPALQAEMLTKAPLDSPGLITPDLGVPTAGDLSACTGYAAGLSVGAADSAPPSYISFTCTETADALTIAVPPEFVSFRDTSLPSGVRNLVMLGAVADLVIPKTSNLGMPISGVSNKYAILLAYNAGTPVISVSNIAGRLQLDEQNLISPTTIGGASNSATTIYSAVACAANSPYVVIGIVDVIFTTGTGWSAPTLVQPGGQELLLASESLLGVSGYQKVSRGLIIQYGRVSTDGSGNSSFTFPIPFPNAVTSVIAGGTQGNFYAYRENSRTVSGVTHSLTISSTGAAAGVVAHDVIAFGY